MERGLGPKAHEPGFSIDYPLFDMSWSMAIAGLWLAALRVWPLASGAPAGKGIPR